MSNIRVLFLHGLEASPGTEKHKMLEKVFGRSNVKAPNLKTRQTIMLFTLFFAFLVIVFLTAVVVCFCLLKWYIGLTVMIISIVITVLIHWLAGRGVTQYMLKQAVAIAEKKFKEQRPNVVVAASFGAVVALSMDVPKVPMLFLAPAQDQFTRFMKMKQYKSVADYPYVMIVHGTHDKTVPLDDSIRLVETSEVGKCRLEVIDDNHSLKTVTADDLKSWVEEVYSSGKKQALKMSEEGNKYIDASLFDDDKVQQSSSDTKV